VSEQQSGTGPVFLSFTNNDSGSVWVVPMPSEAAAGAVASVLREQDPTWFEAGVMVPDSLETLIDYVVEWKEGSEVYEAGLRAQIAAALSTAALDAGETVPVEFVDLRADEDATTTPSTSNGAER
jgi:hypothetical protein